MSDSTIEAYRNAANLKSIIRSDPNVLEILETSVYSTIYHWLSKEDGDGEWAKQKLEGPTFIIKRYDFTPSLLHFSSPLEEMKVTVMIKSCSRY